MTKVRREKTPEEVVSGVRRQVRGLETRAKGEDPWMAAEMFALSAEMEAAAVRVVASLREQGYRWEDIGFAMGVSATTACKRYAKRVEALREGEQS